MAGLTPSSTPRMLLSVSTGTAVVVLGKAISALPVLDEAICDMGGVPTPYRGSEDDDGEDDGEDDVCDSATKGGRGPKKYFLNKNRSSF